jgi:hypothetical protein
MKVKKSLKAAQFFKNESLSRQFLHELRKKESESVSSKDGASKAKGDISYEITVDNVVYRVKEL